MTSTVPPRFLYFDLGNVLLLFDHRRAARQLAELSGLDEQRVWDLVFAGGWNAQLDAGSLTSREFYELFCEAAGCRPDFDAMALAASSIFEVNYSMLAVLGRLSAAGHRL